MSTPALKGAAFDLKRRWQEDEWGGVLLARYAGDEKGCGRMGKLAFKSTLSGIKRDLAGFISPSADGYYGRETSTTLFTTRQLLEWV